MRVRSKGDYAINITCFNCGTYLVKKAPAKDRYYAFVECPKCKIQAVFMIATFEKGELK